MLFLIFLLLLFSCENKYEWSNPLDAESTVLPESWAPTNLQLQKISDTQIMLTWEQDEKRIEGFRIEQKIDAGNWQNMIQLGSVERNYTVDILDLTKEYTYRICAFITGRQSDFSNQVVFLIPKIPILLSPAINSTNQSTSPTLSWNVSNGASSYDLQVSISIDFSSYVFNNDVGNVTSRQLNGLNDSTKYYWRVNAKNSYGTSNWSSVWNFTTEGKKGTVIDIDGNVYQTIKIGNQIWMAENLKVTRYRNGESIPNITDNSQWTNLSTGARCAYNNDNNNVGTYGLLYNWHAVNDARGLAPSGWRVPTDADWKELEMYLGMSQSEADATGWRGSSLGGKLKETGTVYWNSPNSGATNESGFTALPGGYRYYYNGTFLYIVYYGFWWSSTESSSTSAWYRYLSCSNSDVYRSNRNKQYGFSVRCVRD